CGPDQTTEVTRCGLCLVQCFEMRDSSDRSQIPISVDRTRRLSDAVRPMPDTNQCGPDQTTEVTRCGLCLVQCFYMRDSPDRSQTPISVDRTIRLKRRGAAYVWSSVLILRDSPDRSQKIWAIPKEKDEGKMEKLFKW
ncbi:hypothetical protein J6590_106136, partial [Homalodisca vitripennis]